MAHEGWNVNNCKVLPTNNIHTHTIQRCEGYIEQLNPINFVAHSHAYKQTWNNRKICAKKKWRRSGAVLFTKHKELKCIALLIKCFIVADDVLAYQVYFKCVEMSFCLYSYLSSTKHTSSISTTTKRQNKQNKTKMPAQKWYLHNLYI